MAKIFVGNRINALEKTISGHLKRSREFYLEAGTEVELGPEESVVFGPRKETVFSFEWESKTYYLLKKDLETIEGKNMQ